MPFIKTGGLADVVGTLPAALKKKGMNVSVIIPKYSRIPEKYRFAMEHITDFTIRLGWRNQYVGVDKLSLNGIDFYFADNEYYFKQDYVYTDGDFEAERFCWFARAVPEIMQRLSLIPDILHLNDWQTGLIAMLIKTQYAQSEEWSKVRTVFTIHNLRYQGLMNPLLINDFLGIGQETLESIGYFSCANAMKAGIIYSDAVTTVSPSYAQEIQTPLYGETLDGLIRTRADAVTGILNGIDRKSYNPWSDKAIPSRFSRNSPAGKHKCKAALQKELGLTEDAGRPVIAMVSRLTAQKGLDITAEALPGIIDLGAQVVILGMGDAYYENVFEAMQQARGGSFVFRKEMNDALARRIYAGSDMFLMPSAFEPCGISQLLALRYGALPVVRETGGLKDTVIPYNKFTGEGNGFSFRNYSSDELYSTVKTAAELFYNEKEVWAQLVKNAMTCNFGWENSALQYKELYSGLTDKKE